MLPIQVHFVGPIRRPSPEREIRVMPEQAHTVKALLIHLGYRLDEMPAMVVLVNGVTSQMDQSLQGGERVEILVAIGGG